MKKCKLKKLMTGFLTGVMALAMCMNITMHTFAVDETLPNGTKDNPAGAAITKVLQMPQGTETPTAVFQFDISKVSVDSDTSAAALGTMPVLTGRVSIDGNSANTVFEDKKIVTKNSGNILDGITWPHAGEYIYKVTETADTYSIENAAKETLTYSDAEYELRVYIAEAEDGALYVKAAGAVIKKEQEGSIDGNGEKIDPSVPGTAAEGNNFKFVNTYTKILGGGEEPNLEKQSVAISKAVAGDMASKTKYFPFEVEITNNSLALTDVYKAYICTLSGGVYTKVSAAEANNQYDPGQVYVSVTAGTVKDITLKHGQYLVFMDCPQGTVYNVNEKAVQGYKAAVHVVTGGIAVNPDLSNPTPNISLSTGDRIIAGGGANSADFTNTYATVTPTGVLIDNLPFIVMILIAILAFIAFIVNKRRKMTR